MPRQKQWQLTIAVIVAIGALVLVTSGQRAIGPPIVITNGNAVIHCDVDVDKTCPPELDSLSPGEALEPSFAPAEATQSAADAASDAVLATPEIPATPVSTP